MKWLKAIQEQADQERKRTLKPKEVKKHSKKLGGMLLILFMFLFIMAGNMMDRIAATATSVEIIEVKEEPQEEPAPVEAKPDVSAMTVEEQIRHWATEENFEWPDYLVKLAICESRLDPLAVRVKGNSPAGSRDRGVFQINDYWQKQVTDDVAFSVEKSTKWTMDKINAGGQGIWVCDRKIKGRDLEQLKVEKGIK